MDDFNSPTDIALLPKPSAATFVETAGTILSRYAGTASGVLWRNFPSKFISSRVWIETVSPVRSTWYSNLAGSALNVSSMMYS